jgi:hypothetical protein
MIDGCELFDVKCDNTVTECDNDLQIYAQALGAFVGSILGASNAAIGHGEKDAFSRLHVRCGPFLGGSFRWGGCKFPLFGETDWAT